MQISVRRSSAASSQSLEMFDAAQPSLGGLWQQLRLKVARMRDGVTRPWGRQTSTERWLPGVALGMWM